MDEKKTAGNVVLIGECLRAKREETRLSLDKISQKTKISINILRALEANDFQSLPSPAYVKGFVLSYARVVGLNPSEIINKLEYTYLTVTGKPFPALNHTKMMGPSTRAEIPEDAEQAPAPVTQKPVDPAQVLEQDRIARERRRVVVPSLVFVGIAIAFIGLYQLVTHTIDSETGANGSLRQGPTFVPSSELVDINKPVSTEQPKPVEAPPAPEVAKTPPPPVEATKEVKTGPEKPAQAVPEQKAAATTVRRNFPDKDFRKITVKLFSVIPDAPENTDEAILPSSIRGRMTKDMENVYVHAVDGNTWLSYKVDGKPIESVILEKGKDVFLQGKEVLIFLGNVRVTKVFYQNRLIDPPTKTGFKSLIFPEANNGKHMLPLFPKAADDILYTAEEYQRRMKIEEEELGLAKKTE